MNDNPALPDWTGSRGNKWSSQLSGMEAMLAPVNEPLIRALKLEAPARIADIGCGGGATTLEILRRARAGTVVHGFDISPASIRSARAQTPPDPRAIAFEVADMASAAPPGEFYDRLVSRFGVMFFDDPDSAFTNLLHWLAPHGRFSFAVWGPLAENPWMTTVRQVVAEMIDMPPSDPEAPGPFRYADANKLLTLLERAGFGDLVLDNWNGALPIGGGLPPAEAANFALASFSNFGELLAEAGNEALHQARQSLTARLAPHQQDGAVRMDASVHIFTGVRPTPS
jgi:SAM-dependent methyltransferase